MSAEVVTKKRGRPKKAVLEAAEDGVTLEPEAPTKTTKPKVAKKSTSTSTPTSTATKPNASNARKTDAADVKTTKKRAPSSSKSAATSATTRIDAPKARSTASASRLPAAKLPSTSSSRHLPEILKHARAFVTSSIEFNESALAHLSTRDPDAKRTSKSTTTTSRRASALTQEKQQTSPARTSQALGLSGKGEFARASRTPKQSTQEFASPPDRSMRHASTAPARTPLSKGPSGGSGSSTIPPPPPAPEAPPRPTELPLDALKKDPKFRQLSRRWTSVIVALPVALVTSYYLWKRYLEQQEYLQNRQRPVRTLEYHPSKSTEAAELQALRKGSDGTS